MKLTSPQFENGATIPVRYTCDGEGCSPPLVFTDVPERAQSLALIMEDPDVPTHIRADGMFDHWLIWNIPPTVERIEEGTPPKGREGRNTAGKTGYAPPCPPDREHRYFFRAYALDTELTVEEGANKDELLVALEGHIMAQAELVGHYERI